MKIKDMLSCALTLANYTAENKTAFFHDLAEDIVSKAQDIPLQPFRISQALIAREALGSTGIGGGLAIPHAKLADLQQLSACFIQLPKGLHFDAIDGGLVYLVFVLLVPEYATSSHLKALGRISKIFRNKIFRAQLRQAQSQKELYEKILLEDAKYK